jgi:ABC-type branched-subunit amino acid transport system substrate-binding protein
MTGDGVMNPRRLRVRATTAGLATLLVGSVAALAGCSGSSSHPTVSAASTCSPQAPGVTASRVKIGLIYPDTGPDVVTSTFTGARSAVEARIGLQNSLGGVNGRQIDLVWGDDRSDATRFSAVAHDLIDNQQVFGLITASIALDKSADWLQAQSIPVAGLATSPAWNAHPNLFHAGNLFNQGGISTFGDYVKAQGGTKAVVVVDPTLPASQSLADQIETSLRGRGVQVTARVGYTGGVTPAHVIDQVKAAGANALIGAILSRGFADLYTQANASGMKLAVALSVSGGNASEVEHRGPAMAGLSISSNFVTAGAPPMIAYKKAMTNFAPELADPEDELALSGYVAADEMIEGLRQAGPCPTRQAFVQNLRKVTDFNADGLVAPIDLSKPTQPDTCLSFVKVNAQGNGFAAVPPPAALGQHDGFWCGQAVQ